RRMRNVRPLFPKRTRRRGQLEPLVRPLTLVLPWLRWEGVANCFALPWHSAELLHCQVPVADLHRTSRVPRPVSSVPRCDGCRQTENGKGSAFLAVAADGAAALPIQTLPRARHPCRDKQVVRCSLKTMVAIP